MQMGGTKYSCIELHVLGLVEQKILLTDLPLPQDQFGENVPFVTFTVFSSSVR